MTAVSRRAAPALPRDGRARRRTLVLGGLPGSGKTTLFRRVLPAAAAGVRGIDSEQVTARIRAAGVRLPYRLLRPVVHAWHRLGVLRGVLGRTEAVVLPDPWTGTAWRATVLAAAARAGRPVRVVLLHASREAAEWPGCPRPRVVTAGDAPSRPPVGAAARRSRGRWPRPVGRRRRGPGKSRPAHAR